MKIFNQYQSVVILVIFFSCNLGTSQINMIESKGLNAENLGLNAMLFYNKDTGFIAGSSDKVTANSDKFSDTFAFVNKTALLYRTSNGGKTWDAKGFGSGYFTNIIYVRNKVFAFKTSEDRLRISIYFSDDFGVSWKEGISFPDGIYDLFYVEDTLYAICSSKTGDSKLYISIDDGDSWILKFVLQYPPFNYPISHSSNLVYLSNSQKDNYFPDLIVQFNVQDSSSEIIKLPPKFDCYFLTNNDNQLKLCGKQDNHIAVYTLKNGKLLYEYSMAENDSMNFPVGFYNYKNEEYIIEGSRHGGDVGYKLVKTIDNGKNWETISLIRDNLITPFCFMVENEKVKAWFYAGAGKFQILH